MSVKKFRLADFLVIFFCLFGAVFFLSMFRFDLNKSIMSLNAEAVGIVQIRYNNVQRRFSDRVLWGRLFTEAPVHLGDLIRVAEHSAATLYIAGDVIDLSANTLIRIHAARDEEGRIIIDLGMGNVSVVSSPAAAVGLNIMGSVVVPQAGTVLAVSAADDVIAIQVNEGTITITEGDGQSHTLETGWFIAMEAPGLQQHVEALLEPPPSPPSFMEAVFQTTAELFTALPLPQAAPVVPAAGAVTVIPPPEIPEEEPQLESEPVVVAAPPPPPAPATVSVPVPAPPPEPPSAPLGAVIARYPASGHRITLEELRTARRVNFSWLPVEGANAYILTLYHGSGAGRRQVTRTEPLPQTNWTLTNLALLDSGTFTWNVEALNIDPSGITINRGRIVENTFVVDIRLPGVLGTVDIIEVIQDD